MQKLVIRQGQSFVPSRAFEPAHQQVAAAILAMLFCGCSPDAVPPSISANPTAGATVLTSESWTLDDGSALDASVVMTTVDEFTSYGSLVIEHTFSSPDQTPLDSVSFQLIETGAVGGQVLIPRSDTTESAGATTRVFELPLSIPSGTPVEFHLQQGGKTLPDPIPWTISWTDVPE